MGLSLPRRVCAGSRTSGNDHVRPVCRAPFGTPRVSASFLPSKRVLRHGAEGGWTEQASGGPSAPREPDADQAAGALLTGSGVMTERLWDIVHHGLHDRRTDLAGQAIRALVQDSLCETPPLARQ